MKRAVLVLAAVAVVFALFRAAHRQDKETGTKAPPASVDKSDSAPPPAALESTPNEKTPANFMDDGEALRGKILRRTQQDAPASWAARAEARITKDDGRRIEAALFVDDVRVEFSEHVFDKNPQGRWEENDFPRRLPREMPPKFPAVDRTLLEASIREDFAGRLRSLEESHLSWWADENGLAVPCIYYFVKGRSADGSPVSESRCLDARDGRARRRNSLID